MHFVRRMVRVARSPLFSLLWLVVLGGSTGCYIGEPGELGQERFEYSCTGPSDPYCDHDSWCDIFLQGTVCSNLDPNNGEMPPAIARGATFSVDRIWGGGPLHSASPAMVSGSLGAFTAHEDGRVALLATNGGTVYDFIYVKIQTPERIQLDRVDTSTAQSSVETLRLDTGGQALIRATSRRVGGVALAGTLPCSWSVAPASTEVLALTSSADDNLMELQATGTGTALVTVTLGDLEASLTVTVTDPNGCTDTADCDWSNVCGFAWPGECAPVPCGDAGQGWPGEVHGACSVNDATGICLGDARTVADRAGGRCLEAGALLPGAPCQVQVDPFTVQRSIPQCERGLCLAEPGNTVGSCVSVCDWERHYDVAFHSADATTMELPCGAGDNCVSTAYVDPESGLRQPGQSLCRPTHQTNPFSGTTACSLVTGTLLTAASTTCASALVEPSAVCQPVTDGVPAGTQALGTLLGECTVPVLAPDRHVWDDCSDATAICPPRTRCAPEGLLLGEPAGVSRCVPFCDTLHNNTADASCLSLIQARNPAAVLIGSPTCVSWSLAYDDPANGLLGGQDLWPTRLGACQVLP